MKRFVLFLIAAFAALATLAGEVVLKSGEVEVVGPQVLAHEKNAKFPFFDSFAAKELSDLLSEAFGTKVPVVAKPSGKCFPIYILHDTQLERDDIRIEVKKSDIKIFSGAARVYGVYEFLERYAGCRFYFPGPLGTIVPKRSKLVVPLALTIQRA